MVDSISTQLNQQQQYQHLSIVKFEPINLDISSYHS